MFCEFCREFPNSKNMQYSLRIKKNNFQTESRKAHEASKGHALSSSRRPTRLKPRLDECKNSKGRPVMNDVLINIFSQMLSNVIIYNVLSF